MEYITYLTFALTAGIMIYCIFKVIKFFFTDNSAGRYEYETVTANGQTFEKVKDTQDNWYN